MVSEGGGAYRDGLRMRTHALAPIKTTSTTKRLEVSCSGGSGNDGGGTIKEAAKVEIGGGGGVVELDEEDVEEPLSPGARVFHAPKTNCFIIAIIGCKTEIDVGVIKHGLKQSLIKHPRFSSKLVFDAKDGKSPKSWKRTEVNIDDHVIIPAHDTDQSSPSTADQFLEDYVSNLTTLPMDLTKPLWQIHVLNMKTSDANSIAIMKLHHSLGDGMSLISLILACTRKTSDPEALPSVHTKSSNKKADQQGNSRRLSSLQWFYSGLMSLLLLFKVLWNTMVDMTLFLCTALFLKDKNCILEGRHTVGTTERKKLAKRIVHRTFSLDDVKFLKNTMNMTINDVIMGITQAGLSRYLNRKYGGEDVTSKEKRENTAKNHLPKDLSLRATLLVNIRPVSGIQDCADMMKKGSKSRWGNEIGYMIVPFHIGLPDDPLDYLRQAKTTIDRKKQSLEAKMTYASAKLLLHILGPDAVANLCDKVLCSTTLSFSNIPGPVEDISFYGHPIAYLAPTVYGHPQAMTIHFQSHADKMTLVISVDQDVIPDPHILCDELEDCLKLMKTYSYPQTMTEAS